jgi:short-subunit dehydrogenase
MNAKSVIILARNKEKLEETVKELKVRFFPL